jgi:hypothetical protein
MGLGGGPGSDLVHSDPQVVDLRDLRRGVYLAQKAEQASTEDAAFLLDEALGVAEGQQAFVAIPDDAVPVVSDAGLLAFQKANNDYRRSRDSGIALSRKLDTDDRRYREALRAHEKAKAELDRIASDPNVNLAEKKRWLGDVFNAVKRLHDIRTQTGGGREEAESESHWQRLENKRILKGLASPPPPSPLPEAMRRERERARTTLADRTAHRGLSWYNKRSGEETDAYYMQKWKQHRDSAVEGRIGNVLDRLKQASPYPMDEIPFKILDTQGKYNFKANASATTIYFQKGYLDLLAEEYKGNPKGMEDELLAVAGHEMAHVQRDHVAKGAALEKGIDIKDYVFVPDFHSDAELNEQYALLARNVRVADTLRSQEEEADLLGSRYALSAGASPAAIKKLMDRLIADEKDDRVPLNDTLKKRPQGNVNEERVNEMLKHHHGAAHRFGVLERTWGKEFWKHPNPYR